MLGLFGDMFDFNGDGEMDSFERAAEFAFLDEMMNDEEEEEETELELSGLDPDELEFMDPDELEFMDPDERREVLEEAGLEPEDYDF